MFTLWTQLVSIGAVIQAANGKCGGIFGAPTKRGAGAGAGALVYMVFIMTSRVKLKID